MMETRLWYSRGYELWVRVVGMSRVKAVRYVVLSISSSKVTGSLECLGLACALEPKSKIQGKKPRILPKACLPEHGKQAGRLVSQGTSIRS